MNEDELTYELASAAADVTARPDLAEVELGAGRIRGRRRIATGVVAAMLVAAAGGAGFGLGHSFASDEGATSASAPESTVVADLSTDAAPSSVAPSSQTDGTLPVDSVPAAQPPPTIPATTFPVAVDVDSDVGFGTDATSSYYMPDPLELVYQRQLDAGVRVRALKGESWGEAYPPDAWQPAPFCWGTRELRISLDGADVVDIVSASWFDELYGDVEVNTADAGWADGQPMRVMTVQVRPGVTEVAASWPDGGADRAPVVDGLAVLVMTGQGAYDSDYTLEITDETGVRTLTAAELGHWDDPAWREACEPPPPPLPDAGEQPVDPVAAEAAIYDRFALLWDRSIERADKPDDLLADWTGVAEAVEALDDTEYAATAETAVHTIEELVFTGPTEAWFRYSIDTDISFFSDRYGTATLVGDVWQFPRAVMCQDLGLAGPGCEPYVEQIYPPSWYERYGAESCWEEPDGSTSCQSGDVYVGESALVTNGGTGTLAP